MIIIATPALVGVTGLLIGQIQVIKQNHTMLERLAKKRLVKLAKESEHAIEWKFVPPYFIDERSNFTAVFGTNPWYWLLPIDHEPKFSSDLTYWPLNPRYLPPILKPHG